MPERCVPFRARFSPIAQSSSMPLATDARLNVLGLLRHFVGKATGQNDGRIDS